MVTASGHGGAAAALPPSRRRRSLLRQSRTAAQAVTAYPSAAAASRVPSDFMTAWAVTATVEPVIMGGGMPTPRIAMSEEVGWFQVHEFRTWYTFARWPGVPA